MDKRISFVLACVVALSLPSVEGRWFELRAESGGAEPALILTSGDGEENSEARARESDTNADSEMMLEAHNTWRRKHGVPPLRWSPKLARYAKAWADTLLREDRFEHRRGSPYGENLATGSGRHLSPAEAVNLWTAERKNYDHATNTCASGEVCGHFTQVVWKRTREVGCGFARGGGREVWVCNYDPPGNVIGSSPY